MSEAHQSAKSMPVPSPAVVPTVSAVSARQFAALIHVHRAAGPSLVPSVSVPPFHSSQVALLGTASVPRACHWLAAESKRSPDHRSWNAKAAPLLASAVSAPLCAASARVSAASAPVSAVSALVCAVPAAVCAATAAACAVSAARLRGLGTGLGSFGTRRQRSLNVSRER